MYSTSMFSTSIALNGKINGYNDIISYSDFSDVQEVRKIGVKIKMSILISKMC